MNDMEFVMLCYGVWCFFLFGCNIRKEEIIGGVIYIIIE